MPTPSAAFDKYTKIAGMLALLIGFGMTLTSLFNSMPTIWFIHSIGPFQAEILRGAVFFAAIVVVIATRGFTHLAAEKKRSLIWLGAITDIVFVVATAYVSYQFTIVTLKLQNELFFFSPIHSYITLTGVVIIIALCWRVWGAPLALFGILLTLYYFLGEYTPGIFHISPMAFYEQFAEDVWFNLSKGALGQVFEIVVFTVFPFIVFGAMLEATGTGGSLIRFAFMLTRNTRGGPAHAAVLASSLFGTMSGVPVANVVGTGVLTIPMIKRRGFTPTFAGAIEATASTGGQIMPPVMGAAAIIMADILQVSYLVVIVAAIIPALLYYFSLFFTVTFEARRLNIQKGQGGGADMDLAPGDITNLLILAGAIAVIVTILLIGFSASAAGVLVICYMIPVSFFSREVRREPKRVIEGMAKGGIQFSELLIAVGVVGIVLAVLSSTGLPIKIANSIDALMGQSLFIALAVSGLTAIVFGMGMPTLPAYLTIILILGPTMTKLGLLPLVAHMFVFYFGCSSSITPPVAIAAYAGASIAGAGALKTGFMAIRIGATILLVPFVFAYYPEILLVKEAGGFEIGALISILARLGVAIWLLTSSFSRFDALHLAWPEVGLRIALMFLVLLHDPLIHWPAFLAGILLIGFNYLRAHRLSVASTA